MATPQDNDPQNPQGSTRIVAGQAATPKRPLGLKIGLVAGVLALIGGGVAVASAVSGNSAAGTGTDTSAEAAAPAGNPAAELKLGYFGNVTHAPALVGVSQGYHRRARRHQAQHAGLQRRARRDRGAERRRHRCDVHRPEPRHQPVRQERRGVGEHHCRRRRGGAQLVVKPEITSAADLKGKTLASPQLGGTQDVALRAWVSTQGYKTNVDGSGDVAINPTENAQTLKLFQDGKLDGAWLPEPWASRLVLQAGAKVLVDEKDLWDGSLSGKTGEFPTTILIVNKKFAADHPDTVKALLKGHAKSVEWLNTAPAAEKSSVINAALKDAAGAELKADVIERSLKNIVFTVDPLAGTYPKLLKDGVEAGTTKQADINGIFDLRALNAVTGEKTSAAGLGKE